jgi:hypothetical protein
LKKYCHIAEQIALPQPLGPQKNYLHFTKIEKNYESANKYHFNQHTPEIVVQYLQRSIGKP